MSVLFWLFGLGAVGAAFPFLFHLIRRTPKGQTQFSSLMFLKPSPPTLTRRSRLENLLLLTLRMAVVLLVAFAFMRPFLRGANYLSFDNVANRRIAILLDVSASMQRGDLWQQATSELESILAELEEEDQVGLFTFDQQVKPVVGFLSQTVPQSKTASNEIRKAIDDIRPGSRVSNIGQALVTTADQLAAWKDNEQADDPKNTKLQIIVISDLQKGSNTDSLQAYQWPSDVFVRFRVVSTSSDNATVQVLDPIEEDDRMVGRRVRVKNFEDSIEEQFFVNCIGMDQRQSSESLPFFVGAGTSRVVELDDEQTASATEFVLSGDEEAFDNSYFVVPPQLRSIAIEYFGSEDANDPREPFFYLERALVDSDRIDFRVRKRDIKTIRLGEAAVTSSGEISNEEGADLIVVAAPVEPDAERYLDEYLQSGGTALFVLRTNDMLESTARWTLAQIDDTRTAASDFKKDYAMLAEIDFGHPLFATFDSPKFNDFTGIRFWNHRRVVVEDSDPDIRVLARFDDDSPAVWERLFPRRGRVIVFASSWAPDDSQLALSTKFVPFMVNIVDLASNVPEFKSGYLVGDTIELPPLAEAGVLRLPGGTEVTVEAGRRSFDQTDEPGIYQWSVGEQTYSIAVNIDRSESEVEAIPIEQFEMMDLNVGTASTASAEIQQLKNQRDQSLESEQKIWKWLILSAIVLLIIETWVAGATAIKSSVGPAVAEETEMSGEMA
jgi:hypothetical protein